MLLGVGRHGGDEVAYDVSGTVGVGGGEYGIRGYIAAYDVKTGKECEGVGVTPDGRWVWAGNRAEDTISIIDTRTLEVTKRIQSPGFPYRVQFTPNGTLALIPHATPAARPPRRRRASRRPMRRAQFAL